MRLWRQQNFSHMQLEGQLTKISLEIKRNQAEHCLRDGSVL